MISIEVEDKMYVGGDCFIVDNKKFYFVEYTDYSYACMEATLRDEYGSEFKGCFLGTMKDGIDVLEIGETPFYIPYE